MLNTQYPMDFSRIILTWYEQNKRALPWRKTLDPYHIWVSEIIMQQTRIDQGTAYYERFVSLFPTIIDLANASEDLVLKTWQGLGYYSRARNMHATAKNIKNNFNGVFPSNYNEILGLKGIGAYTAAAISSISFNLPFAVVDGNVFRVLSRVFGIETPIDSSIGIREFYELSEKLIDKRVSGDYNQAVMEFGALFCVPLKPDCENCCLIKNCVAYNTNRVLNLPVKEKKTKIRKRYFNYFVIEIESQPNYTYINKRIEKDIFHNLYEFPMIETEGALKEEDMEQLISNFLNSGSCFTIRVEMEHRQVLSHQHIYAKFIRIGLPKEFSNGYLFVAKKDLMDVYPVHNLIARYLNFNKD